MGDIFSFNFDQDELDTGLDFSIDFSSNNLLSVAGSYKSTKNRSKEPLNTLLFAEITPDDLKSRNEISTVTTSDTPVESTDTKNAEVKTTNDEINSVTDFFDVYNSASPFYDQKSGHPWWRHKSVTLEAAYIDFPENDVASPGVHFSYTMQRLDIPWLLNPAPKFGVVANSDFNQASYGYAALSWNFFFTENLYSTFDFGIRGQSGSDDKDYGSYVQFHESVGLYYRLFEGKRGYHEIGGSVSHGSHAGFFGDENPGLDTFTFGYRFSFKPKKNKTTSPVETRPYPLLSP